MQRATDSQRHYSFNPGFVEKSHQKEYAPLTITPTPSIPSLEVASAGDFAWQALAPYARDQILPPARPNDYFKTLAYRKPVRKLVHNDTEPRTRMGRSTFRVFKPNDCDGGLIYLAGKLAGTLCYQCAKGGGPFKGCVVPAASDGLPPACGNCVYRDGRTLCSFQDENNTDEAAEWGDDEVYHPLEKARHGAANSFTKEAWEDLVPHSAQYTVPPQKSWLLYDLLAHRAPLRPLFLNHSQARSSAGNIEFRIQNHRDCEAGLVYLTGLPAKSPCTRTAIWSLE